MMMTNRLVTFTSALCAVWILLYTLLSGLPLHHFYGQMAESVLGDAKGGPPMLNLAIPILIAGTIASLCWKQRPSRSTNPTNNEENNNNSSIENNNSSSLVSYIIPHQWIIRIYNMEGDWNMDLWAICMLLFPSVVLVAMRMYNHMHGNEVTLDEQLKETSNSFAVVAEVVGSILLIPVARHSSLLKVMGWSQASAVRIHIWAGRIFILAVLIHGGMHMFRWMTGNDGILTMIIPPAGCWTWDEEQYETFQPACAIVDDDDDANHAEIEVDCTCYSIFRNFTGVGGGLAVVVLLLTSLHVVRRRFYSLFYMSHIIAAPLAIILTVLHWNRSILYMAPSLLYYAASSLPTFLERRFQSNNEAPGVKVVKVERIPSLSNEKKCLDASSTKHYISLTFEATAAAMQQFRPGYYVQLLAPQISSISHPFTVNTVPGKDNQLRVIFKVLGNFTSSLSQQIEDASSNNSSLSLEQQDSTSSIMPELHLDGYLGTPNRVGEVLRHDVAVMVAGGIGITPYLSLIHQVHDILSTAAPNTYPTKRIVLLWICRDADLVDYVREEYILPLLQKANKSGNSNDDFKIKFLIHHTSNHIKKPLGLSYSDDEENAVPTALLLDSNHREDLSSVGGVPFSPSKFAAGLSSTLKTNILSFVAFSSITWPGMAAVWWLYTNLQDKQHISTRMAGLLVISIIGMAMAVFVNVVARLPYFGSDDPPEEDNEAQWQPLLATAQESTDSFDIEMEGVPASAEKIGSLTNLAYDEDFAGTKRVIIEEKQGRPSVHEMLNFADNGRHPGLFTCGPLGMMQDIREHTEERCLLRLQQCMQGASNYISLYEEAFNM